MTPILSINFRIKISPTIPVADLRIRVTPPHSGPFDPLLFDPDLFDMGWKYYLQPHIDISVNDDLATSVFPRESREQVISPFLLSVGGNEIPYYRRLTDMVVSESIEGISSFSFSMPRRSTSELDPYIESLGQPKSWLGVPGGKQAIDISAIYNTESGSVVEVPVIRNGLLDNSSSHTSVQSDTRTWNGSGAHARIDRKPITYQAPPGHGQKSSTVVRRILQLAGIDSTKVNISSGRRMYKEISLIDAKPIESCNQILLPENRRLFHDSRTDTWTTVDYSGIEGKRVECIITESDILSTIGTLGDSEANDAPTSIVLTSTAQVTRDQCGRRTVYQVIDTFSVTEIQGYFSRQTGVSGIITPNASVDGWAGSSAELRHSQRIIIVKEIDCDTLVAEETVTYRWFSPEAERYILDSTGAIVGYIQNVYFYEQGVVADDSTKSYLWPTQRFVPVSWVRVEMLYNDDGYLVRRDSIEGGWRMLEGPMKDRSSSSSSEWQSVDFVTGPTGRAYTGDLRMVEEISPGQNYAERWYGPIEVYYVDTNDDLGTPSGLSKRGVSGPFGGTKDEAGSLIFPGRLSQEITEYDVNDSGFVISETTTILSMFAAQGVGNYLYRTIGESPHSRQDFRVSETRQTKYSATSESNHDRISLAFKYTGELINQKVETNLDGYLPVADQRQDIVPPLSAFENPSDHEFALAASRHENRPIKVEISAPALESVMEPWQMKGNTVQYAENEQDLINLGTFIIRELSSIQVDYPVLLNTLLRPGHRVILHLPSLGIHYDHIVLNLQHIQSAKISYTQVTGRYDVI